jgi:hypothetical protein
VEKGREKKLVVVHFASLLMAFLSHFGKISFVEQIVKLSRL